MDLLEDHIRSCLPCTNELPMLLDALIKICFLVRGKTPFVGLNIENIDMTNTAKKLLEIQNQKYAFESIEGMSLDCIRDIINNFTSIRQKYTMLIKHFFGEDFDVSLLYQSQSKLDFYQKANHYHDF